MAELTTLKKSQSAHRNAVNKLISKASDVMGNKLDNNGRLDLEVLLREIEVK